MIKITVDQMKIVKRDFNFEPPLFGGYGFQGVGGW